MLGYRSRNPKLRPSAATAGTIEEGFPMGLPTVLGHRSSRGRGPCPWSVLTCNASDGPSWAYSRIRLEQDSAYDNHGYQRVYKLHSPPTRTETGVPGPYALKNFASWLSTVPCGSKLQRTIQMGRDYQSLLFAADCISSTTRR